MFFLSLFFLFLAVTCLCLPAGLFYQQIHPRRSESVSTPDDLSLPFEHITFLTDDNISLAGWLIVRNPNAPTIIICHGLGSSKNDMMDNVVCLVDVPCNIFLFDLRAHGESEGACTSFGFLEQKDLSAAISFLNTTPLIQNKSYGLWGESMGAVISVLEGWRHQNVKAVWLDSCFFSLARSFELQLQKMNFPVFPFLHIATRLYAIRFRKSVVRVSPVDVIAKLSPRPIFVVCGTEDARVPEGDFLRLFDAAEKPKEMWFVPGARHVETLRLYPEEYGNRVRNFFASHLCECPQ